PPPPVDPASEFDAARAFERLSRILGDDRPHPVDTDANDAVRERLRAEIRGIGFDPEVRDDFACRVSKRRNALSCARVRNIVFRAGPATGDAILVASHYDSVAAGPGAADDGAGVAASLELAAILKQRRPVKPVIFLITDGEEAGLLGAHSFVRHDPLAKEVASVINMEARGVSGPAIIFQTSEQNSRDIAAYSSRATAPVGNSLATDIYKMMPNDTDLSEFLSLDADAINLAFTGTPPFYHTPRDTFANLDRRSFAHIGASALSSVDGFLRDVDYADTAPEKRVVFADVFSRFMIVTPELAALAMIVLGFAASAVAFIRIPGARPLRAAFAPLIAMGGAGLAAFASLWIVSALGSEDYYWSAEPHWARAVIYLSAIAAGAGALSFAAGADRRRLLAASWFWFSLLGLIAFAVAPGSALLTGLPAALFACAVIASAGAARLIAPLSVIGAVAALLLWLPTLHHAEVGLGLGAAWPFAILAALLFMLAAPVAVSAARLSPSITLATVAALFAAIVLAATAPAYSPAAPRPLNIQHLVDAANGEAYWSLSPKGDRPPAEMAALASFSLRDIAGLSGERLTAAAPPHDGQAVGFELVSSVDDASGRTLSLRLAANGADEIILIAPEEAGLVDVAAGGEKSALAGKGEKIIRCLGRGCADFSLVATLGRAPAEWTIIGVRHGLAADGLAMKSARPDWAVPAHAGDVRMILSRQMI
ncbi:MAG: M20/M25/M40 family metallo-hydrolase, partial [Pseudomonadota bacterium]